MSPMGWQKDVLPFVTGDSARRALQIQQVRKVADTKKFETEETQKAALKFSKTRFRAYM